MNFIVKNGPFIKTKNDKLSIEAVTFISLIPFLIYRIILNPVNNLIILILLLLSTLPLSIFIDYIKNKKINIMDYINDLNYVLIMSILVPINIPYELIFTCNIVLIILSKFIDFINYKSLLIFIIFIYFQFINKNYILSDYNIYLYLIIYITMFIVLIYKRAIKFRIVLLFILISSFSYLIKGNIDNNIFILLFSSIYLISDFKSTPNSAFIQYIYGGTLGLISLFLPVDYLFIFVVIISIIFKILDRYYIYYLAK